MEKGLIWFIPAILAALGILALSTFLSIPIQVKGVHHIDKWEHTFAYLILSFSFLLALKKSRRFTKHLSLVVLFSACIYGFALEFIQYQFFTNRSFEWIDALANVLGAVLGFSIFHFLIQENEK
ncbi:MAG: VanZ family protein [Bacteroidota bacterium]